DHNPVRQRAFQHRQVRAVPQGLRNYPRTPFCAQPQALWRPKLNVCRPGNWFSDSFLGLEVPEPHLRAHFGVDSAVMPRSSRVNGIVRLVPIVLTRRTSTIEFPE